jgi:hypothetical protein
LKRREYNDKVIESGFSKASEINRNDLLEYKEEKRTWPTVDEGLDTAALTSVSLMLLGRRNATTGGLGNNLTNWMTLADPKFISLTTIQIGKKIKDRKERVFGSTSYKHYTSSCYGTLVCVAIGDRTCNACHHMVYTGRPSMKV